MAYTGGATPERLLLRVKAAADLADVSRTTAYDLVARGEWPHVRIGAGETGIRVVRADLLDWIERRKRRGYGYAGSGDDAA